MTLIAGQTTSEEEFVAHVGRLTAEARAANSGRAQLVELLRDTHPVYRERGAAAVVRMRGWILLALGQIGVTDGELIYLLEELDNGRDPYLIATAARALRSYPTPRHAFLAVVQQALASIRYDDETVSLDTYGGDASSTPGTTASSELRATERWLEANAPRQHACCSESLRHDIGTSIARESASAMQPYPPLQAMFEDQDRERVGFAEFFRGKPTVAAFFYTRCNNPQKCSLTVTKLGRLQKLLHARGLASGIRTAAITYDPGFDIPHRLRSYALDRDVTFGVDHRFLRATQLWDEVRAYFDLGVNFVGSIVNRHRVELYVLDTQGRIAILFERLQWNEEEVLTKALELLQRPVGTVALPAPGTPRHGG